MKNYSAVSIGDIRIEWKRASRKNGKPIVTARNGAEQPLMCEAINLLDSAARGRFAKDLSDKANIDAEAVKTVLMQMAAELAAELAADDEENEDEQGEAVESDPLASMPEEVRQEGRAMLESPDLMGTIARDIAIAGVAGEEDLSITFYLVGTSRLLRKPLYAIAQGSTSSGKSHVIETVADLFPSETTLNVTQMTPKALFYLPPGTLKHRWVVAGERSRREDKHTAEATRALREMISSGELKLAVPRKSGEGYVTETICQDGPIAYVESTTLTQIFAEDANRMLMLNTDEHVRQTQRVIDQLGETYSNLNGRTERERVITKHHAAQRMLQQYDVVVPFANQLGQRFPTDRVEARRAFPQMNSMIQAVCLLHQFQRETDEHGHLIATKVDYEIARRLLLKPLDRLLRGRVSTPVAEFLDRLKQRFQVGDVFTREEAARGEHKAQRTVELWLKELHEAGLIEQVAASRGPRAATWRLPDALGELESPVLPTVEDVFGQEEATDCPMAD